ncbi:MAG: response regulator transcription factor [Deltaproteobacteria bacterium]|nr:response regulator transcription factor [Deltaproteobacteria bacterium]
MRIRVGLVEDHRIVREGLRALLAREADFEPAGEAGTAAEAVELAGRERPDVLVLDVGLPGGSGVDALKRILAASPRTKVVVLSMHAAESVVRAALRAGAVGYVTKGRGLDDLVRAVRAAAAGQSWFSPDVAGIVREDSVRAGIQDPLDPFVVLSAREREVLALLVDGKTSKEAANVLGISERTVEGHRAAIRDKVGARTTADLVRYALERGLGTG